MVEATPDTVITMTNGEKHMVRESIDDIRTAFTGHKRQIFEGAKIGYHRADGE